MTQKPNSVLFDTYAENYDRLQPIRIEMYQFYHQLALDRIEAIGSQLAADSP